MSPLLQRTLRQEWQVYEQTRRCFCLFAPGSETILTSLMSTLFHGVIDIFADQQHLAPISTTVAIF